MNKAYNCLVKFIPTGKFYFGGEIGHKSRGRGDGRDAALTSYIVRSQIFPQQTTLLGALRYAIWQLSGKPLHNAPIGDTSFHLSKPLATADFGCIKSLSELYIFHNAQYYWLQPLYQHLAFNNGQLQDYDHKKIPPQYFVSHNQCQLKDTLLQKSEQVGVITYASKKRWQTEDDEAFYRQSFYEFKSPDDGFAFLVELDDSEKGAFVGKNLLMPVGGENSQFKVSIEPLPDDFQQPVFQNKDDTHTCHKIILTSDALLTNEAVDTADFAISETVDFRFMNTRRSKTQDWHDLQQNNAANNHKSPSFSEKYELFARGSVFYFSAQNKLQSFTAALEAQAAMRQIGYNQYVFQ